MYSNIILNKRIRTFKQTNYLPNCMFVKLHMDFERLGSLKMLKGHRIFYINIISKTKIFFTLAVLKRTYPKCTFINILTPDCLR